ncbi:MAG: hypothetical protein F4X40_08735 [Chloroflexi bacterium]|nr:hypothetical protein [Chloroflexota bacterium]
MKAKVLGPAVVPDSTADLQHTREFYILISMGIDLNVDDLVDRTKRGELVWELAEDESGWSVDHDGTTIVLRVADANLEVVEGRRRVLATKNSEAAPLGDLLMEICPLSVPTMPEDPRELARALFRNAGRK